MKFVLFLGCQIPVHLHQYETSSRAVLTKLGVDLVGIDQFNCCGYPVRNLDLKTFVLFSARNLALASKEDLDLLCLCKCCYGSLKHANHMLQEDGSLREETNEVLQKQGLRYDKDVEVKHLLTVLYHEVGLDSLKEKMERTFGGLKIAAQYGCHALRPSDIVQFDDPVAPAIFDRLVEATGAESIYWPMRLECCGAPLVGVNDDLSMDLTERKLLDAKQSGADYLCAACTYCQIQYDAVQQTIIAERERNYFLPSILYPQLLGLTMGIDDRALGLKMNRLSVDGIEDFFVVPEPEEGTEEETEEKAVEA